MEAIAGHAKYTAAIPKWPPPQEAVKLGLLYAGFGHQECGLWRPVGGADVPAVPRTEQ